MRVIGRTKLRPLAAGLVLVASLGCAKAKDALKEALGVDQIAKEDVAAMLAAAEWDETKYPNLANFKVHDFGIKLTDKFKGDLSKEVEIPIPFELPSQAQSTAQNQRSIALLRKESFTLGDKTYTRFRIITVAEYNAADQQLKISGDKINVNMDPDQVVSVANGNQAGDYLLVEGKGDRGLAYLTGTVMVKPDGKDKEAVKSAVVFTDSSPFVTVSGSSGKYFLAMLDGSKGNVIAYNKSWGSAYTGTPTSTSVPIPYAGLLSKYEAAFNDKVGSASNGNSDITEPAADLFTKVNTKVTDWLNGWTLVEAHLLFVQPKQEPPAPPPAPADDQMPPQPPTADKPVDTPPPANEDPVIVREPPADEGTAPQFDLGCSGFDADMAQADMVRDGSKFDNYTAAPGWRAMGDVHYAYEFSEKIFPAPTDTSRYLDGVPGYCVLTSGDAWYQATSDAAYMPGPDGAGQVSEMWQKVLVPEKAKSIQMRIAFFSQEFPEFVGTQYNDSFFVKFDESMDFIASGNLNDLAGAYGDNCPTKSYTGDLKCGEWSFVKDNGLDGELYDIGSSKQAPPQGSTYKCLATGSTGKKCYHGMIQPRLVCKDLTADEAGKELTLRFNVSDAGDKFFDSALAVDSVVFSMKGCDDDTGRMTDEEESCAGRGAAVDPTRCAN